MNSKTISMFSDGQIPQSFCLLFLKLQTSELFKMSSWYLRVISEGQQFGILLQKYTEQIGKKSWE